MKSIPLALLFVMSCGLLAQAGDLTIKGSDTMLVMNQELAQEYMKTHPGTNIQVSGGGSGVGIAALRNNTTDIAAASRLIKPKEVQDFLLNVGIQPIHYSVALDGICIFVNKSNPLNEITLANLGHIFHGDYTNWKEVGGPDLAINVYSRENTSGTYSFVKDEVLQGQDYSPRAQTLPGTAAVYDAVGKDTKGIGYGGIGYNKGVKVLKIKADANSPAYLPTEYNVDNKIYALSRSLNYYLNPRSNNPEADAYIQWVRSPAGQRVVVKAHYFALPGMLPHKKEHETAVAQDSSSSSATSSSSSEDSLAAREQALERKEAELKQKEAELAQEQAALQQQQQAAAPAPATTAPQPATPADASSNPMQTPTPAQPVTTPAPQ